MEHIGDTSWFPGAVVAHSEFGPTGPNAQGSYGRTQPHGRTACVSAP